VTRGYYKDPKATREAIDEQSWFRTGDLGAFSEDGFLEIVGIKKALFKLSTGKYVTPELIEARLERSPLVERAIAIGAERKFCAALLFPNLTALQAQARELELDLPPAKLLEHPCILALYQVVVDAANCHLPYWATVKRFRLLDPHPIHIYLVPRFKLLAVFAREIEALYRDETGRNAIAPTAETIPTYCPLPPPDCPAFAQSLSPRLTH
jgi:long-chain acyl-CoA synthetase